MIPVVNPASYKQMKKLLFRLLSKPTLLSALTKLGCASRGAIAYRTTYNKPCARRDTWLQGKKSETKEIVTDDKYNGTNHE